MLKRDEERGRGRKRRAPVRDVFIEERYHRAEVETVRCREYEAESRK